MKQLRACLICGHVTIVVTLFLLAEANLITLETECENPSVVLSGFCIVRQFGAR